MSENLCDKCDRQVQGCTISAGRTATCARFRGKTPAAAGWIEYGKSWSDFCKARFNKPGTQISVQDTPISPSAIRIQSAASTNSAVPAIVAQKCCLIR
ncbi:hypothetical protein KAR91_20395 [Candidatus Pacearchaeota archaeon]|nr:hypothetical protein [Candidatus Pacearchaeota archaeon]